MAQLLADWPPPHRSDSSLTLIVHVSPPSPRPCCLLGTLTLVVSSDSTWNTQASFGSDTVRASPAWNERQK